MNALPDTGYDLATGLIGGEHLKHLAKIGIARLVERVNGQVAGCERPLTAADLPGKVAKLVEESGRLSEQLLRCDSVPLQMAADFVKAQVKLAATALPLLLAEVERREETARDAVATVRTTWTGKANGPLIDAVVSRLLAETHAVELAERETQLAPWRTASAIVRDVSVNKQMPRWLAVLLARYETQKLQAAVG